MPLTESKSQTKSSNVRQDRKEAIQIDKDALYGHYQKPTDERVAINNERLKWENKLGRQVAHKALDEPMLDDPDMGIKADKNSTITNNGIGWKELAIIGAMIAGTGATVAYVGEDKTKVEDSPITVAPETPDGEVVVPGIRFGPEE